MHTPGPWRVRNDPRFGIWVDAPNGMVKNDRGPSYARQILEDEEYEEKLADATLVSAATDMLDALRAIYDAIDQGEVTMAHRNQILSAIKKATGEQ